MIIRDFNKKKQERLINPYGVKTGITTIKDLDMTKRTVAGLFNSYFYIDSDLDMLVTGAASKSIQEKGAGSKSGNKIKHLKDHNWSEVIARIDVIDERKVDVDGKSIEGIYYESYYPETTASNDMLIKIQEGLYDDRSIGFRYRTLGVAEQDSEDEDRRKRWDEFYPLALNPEKADEFGFFWVVKEIDLFEGSDVAFGANRLTPLLGVKGHEADNLKYLDYKLKRLMNFSKTNASDEAIYSAEMEISQIKAYIAALVNHDSDLKKIEKESKKVKLLV